MRVFMEESRRYIIANTDINGSANVREVAAALGHMPNGWRVTGVSPRQDGTTVVTTVSNERSEVEL